MNDTAKDLRAWAVIGDKLLQLQNQAGHVTSATEVPEFLDAIEDRLDRVAVGKDLDFRVVGGEHLFFEMRQFLIEFLAGAGSGVLDFDIVVGPEAGQEDEVARQIDNADRFTHIQDEDFAAVAHG